MEVQTDFGARGRVPDMLRYSVDGLLSAELNPSLIQHVDTCLAVIEQRFVSAPAWLRVDSTSFNASNPQDIASALLERASAMTNDPSLCLQYEGADEFIAHQYAPQGLAHGSLLHSASSACRSHLPLSCYLHRVHNAQIGGARLDRNPNRLYRQCLEH